MFSTKNFSLFALGALSALGLVWLIRKRRGQIRSLEIWRQVLMKKHGSENGQRLFRAVQEQYASLSAKQLWPANPSLRWHLKENILPGLSLYRVLLKESAGNQPIALAEVDGVFRTWTLAKNRWLLAPFKIIPAPFRVFKLSFAQMMKKFPIEGWDFTYVENNSEKVAFNATRCFYLKTLTAYGAPELTASFCKTDEVMAELFPPSVRFVRAHTLGRGDQICDFQYCHVPEAAIRAGAQASPGA
jgi:hypothetical protein